MNGRTRERYLARLWNYSGSATKCSTPGKRRSNRRSTWGSQAWLPSSIAPAAANLCSRRTGIGSRCADRTVKSSARSCASAMHRRCGRDKCRGGRARRIPGDREGRESDSGRSRSGCQARRRAVARSRFYPHRPWCPRRRIRVLDRSTRSRMRSWPPNAATSAAGRCWSGT